MRKLLLLLLLLAAPLGAHGQSLTLLGVGGNGSGAAPTTGFQGDLQSGFTEWYGIVTAYTQAYANPGTNGAMTVTRASDSHHCDFDVTNVGGTSNSVNCGVGGDNGQSLVSFLTATLGTVTVPFDQTGNSNNGTACASAPGMGTTTIGGVTTYLNFNTQANHQCFTTNLTNYGAATGTIVWWQYNNDAFNSSLIDAIWGQASDTSHELSCQHYSDNTIYCGWRNPTDNRVTIAATGGNWPLHTWTLYALRWNGSETQLVVNGSVAGTNSNAPGVGNLANAMRIGDIAAVFGGSYMAGNIKSWGYAPGVFISDLILTEMYNSGPGS